MKTVGVHAAKTHLSRLIRDVLAGEEVVITRGKKPLVKLVTATTAKSQKRLGWAKGTVVRISDDFDAPLDAMRAYRR